MDPASYKKYTAGFTESAHGHGHHSHAKIYFVVWIALLIGTALTWWTGRMDLGKAGLLVAMVIATTKASLVVMYFMHMTESRGFTKLVFGTSIFFVGVIFAYVLGDFADRFRPANSPGSAWSDLPISPVLRGERPFEPPAAPGAHEEAHH